MIIFVTIKEMRPFSCILWGNSLDQLDLGIGSLSVTYCCIQNGFSGAGNINANPLLTRFGYRLKSGSPCIDAGTTVGAPATDYEGETRVGPPDMGIDEFVDGDFDGLADSWEMKYFGNLDHSLSEDTDSDGLSNGTEYDLDIDPTYHDIDSDRDGLVDKVEEHYGTDPNDWDSDGDLFPDGWEFEYNFDALDSSDPSSEGDVDSDGLNNFEEMRHGSDPSKADTDGDGVSDGDEVTNGSDPADADDGGDPNNCMSIELTVGDHSGSHSERYGLQVGHVYHVAPTFGEVATETYAFVIGKEYQFEVRWIDTKLSIQDLNYTAKIGKCL